MPRGVPTSGALSSGVIVRAYLHFYLFRFPLSSLLLLDTRSAEEERQQQQVVVFSYIYLKLSCGASYPFAKKKAKQKIQRGEIKTSSGGSPVKVSAASE